jgi:hypothetical protein
MKNGYRKRGMEAEVKEGMGIRQGCIRHVGRGIKSMSWNQNGRGGNDEGWG